VGAVVRQEGKGSHWRIRSGALALLIKVTLHVVYDMDRLKVDGVHLVHHGFSDALQVVIATKMIIRPQLLRASSLALLKALLRAGINTMTASRVPQTRPDDTTAAPCRGS